jgi:flagellar FliL protein
MVLNGSNPRDGLAMTAMIIALLTIIGAGAGYAVGVLMLQTPATQQTSADLVGAGHQNEPVPDKDSEELQDSAQHEQASSPTEGTVGLGATEEFGSYKILALPPIVTTLARPEGKWIRLEGSIAIRGDTDQSPEQTAETIAEEILGYLRTVELEHLQGPSGYLALKDDLNETVRSLSSGNVRRVFVHGLIVE